MFYLCPRLKIVPAPVCIIIIIIIKNEKIKVTLCENAAGALYIVSDLYSINAKYRFGLNVLFRLTYITRKNSKETLDD